MNSAIENLTFLEAFNEYGEVLSDRIRNAVSERSDSVFIGDIMLYIATILNNNGWDPSKEPADKVFSIAKSLIEVVCTFDNISRLVEFSDDGMYLCFI